MNFCIIDESDVINSIHDKKYKTGSNIITKAVNITVALDKPNYDLIIHFDNILLNDLVNIILTYIGTDTNYVISMFIFDSGFNANIINAFENNSNIFTICGNNPNDFKNRKIHKEQNEDNANHCFLFDFLMKEYKKIK
jgi:hypothetical protein